MARVDYSRIICPLCSAPVLPSKTFQVGHQRRHVKDGFCTESNGEFPYTVLGNLICVAEKAKMHFLTVERNALQERFNRMDGSEPEWSATYNLLMDLRRIILGY